MIAPDLLALGARAEAMIRELAEISADPVRLTRLFLTPEHRRAADLVANWMRGAGLAVSEDALGTVRGRLPSVAEREGANAARRLLIGSHIDTVVDAGAYDGTFGVIAGILAAEEIIRRHGALPFGVDVLAFGDEEGSRFASTLSSSAAVAGVFDPGTLRQKDRQGVTLEAALRAYGKDPGDIPAAAYPPAEAAAYLEVHIEQGPVLEAADEALGVVTAIAGQTRMEVVVTGRAGHAGTVPMRLRHDALAAAAEMILAVESFAKDVESGAMVGTVGRLEALPGAPNVVPGWAEFTVDLRAQSDAERLGLQTRLMAAFEDVGRARDVVVQIAIQHEVAAAPCNPVLQDDMANAVMALGGSAIRLPSGAGHDGQSMQKLCPIGMLFVRCREGISHHPAEHARIDDMGRAIVALVRCIETFDADRGLAPRP